RGDLAVMFTAAQREPRERKLAAGETAQDSDRLPDPMMLKIRRVASEFADLAVVRATLSERQLYEVMVDFWTNHFNVYFAKGADRFLTPDYIEHTIRARAMGKFQDLLIATARSPRDAVLPRQLGERGTRYLTPVPPLRTAERGSGGEARAKRDQ